MKDNWDELSVEELKDSSAYSIAMGPFGSNIKTDNFVPSGVPVIRGVNLNADRFLDDAFVYLAAEKADELKSANAFPNDLVFTHRGTLGQVGIIPQNAKFKRYVVSQSQMKLRCDPQRADPMFVFYYFKSPQGQHALLANTSTTGVPAISSPLTTLRAIRIPIPPLPEQRAIAGVLSALDDKIELNRRMNRTLESTARAVFRQWFVESEDVEGWEVVPLPEIVEVNPTRSLKKGEVAPYLDMANMPTQGHRGIEWIDRPFGSGTKFINGDTLLARITPCLENGKTAFVDFLKDDQVGWGSTEYIVFRPKPPLPPEYGYYLARSEELRNHAIVNMTGTSGRQRTPASCFDNFLVSVPPEDLAKRFEEYAKSVIDKVRANDQESRTLASLRDRLLPELMSGKVSVKI
jgi:type I restriction enzyme S subunit